MDYFERCLVLAVTGALTMSAQETPGEDSADTLRGVTVHECEHEGRRYPYSVYLPRAYEPSKAWPCILFLHGMGESGRDPSLPVSVGIGPALREHGERWPFVVVFPQKPLAFEEWDRHAPAVLHILDEVQGRYRIDPDRVALSGISQGGHGCLALADRAPDRFCAVVAVCGYVLSPRLETSKQGATLSFAEDSRAREFLSSLATRLEGTPVRLYHGGRDPVVPARQSELIDEVFRAAGVPVRLRIFAELEHNSWDAAYAESGLADWLLARRRGEGTSEAR